MNDPFGKKINFLYKSDVKLVELIEEFWEIFNDITKIIDQKKREVKEILDQLEAFAKDDQEKFFKSKNPENSNQSILPCLRLLGVNREKTEEVTLKTSRSVGVFTMEDEDSATNEAYSPRNT